MALLKCLACGHENKPGDESCASCTTSLNVKLCGGCEAINASGAAKCYACGAELRAEAPKVKVEDKVEPKIDDKIEVIEMERPARSFPSKHVYAHTPGAAKVVRRVGVLVVLAVVFVAGGVASHFWYRNGAASSAGPSHTVQGKVAMPVEPKVAPAPVVAPAVSPAPAPATATAATSGVTHTRVGAAVAAPAPVVEAPKAEAPKAAAEAPKRKVSPKVAAAAKAAAPMATVPAPEPAAAEATYSKVTHTRKAPAVAIEKPVEAPAPVAPSRPNAANQSAGCAPGVAALGLCK